MGLTIYKSSAGSGKTFTLVRLYLEKVIRSPFLFRGILAITFTNKATEEMKTRIIKELDDLASGNTSSQLAYLLDVLKLTEEEIRKRAQQVLLGILHDYSSFAVSTIDSYFQVLSRTLARELDLPAKYDIELDLDGVCNAVSDQLLVEAGKNKSITNWLQELLLDRLEQGKSWNIRNDLRRMTRQLLTRPEALDHAINSKPDDIIILIRELKKIRNEVEHSMRQFGEEGKRSISEAAYTLENFAYGKSGAANYFFKIAENFANAKSFLPGDRIKKAIDDPNTLLSAANKKNESLLNFVHQELHPLLAQAVDYYLENERSYISVTEALKHIYLAGISGALNEKVKLFRDEFQLFLLSDTTRMLREIVQDDDAAFIYEKTGNTYRHLFIDEFQDTSDEQWQILRPLVLNAISNGNDVLIVGDAKQSIYRWRGGNMHLILQGVRNDLKAFNSLISENKLGTNYRSLPNLVNFNNNFFVHASTLLSAMEFSDPALIAKAYGKGEVEQHVKEGAVPDTGFIEFMFFNSPARKSKYSEAPAEDEEGWKVKALKQIDITIASLLQNGYRLRDIAILIRTGAHEREIADYLYHENKYEFISGNSLLLSLNNSIRFILNCFRLLLDEKNALLHYELNFFLNPEIKNDANQIPFHAKTILADSSSWSNSNLLLWKSQLLAMPVDMAFYRILHLADLHKTDVFIDKFTDILMEFTSSQGTGLSEFLLWWDDHVETRKWSVDIPPDSNAIRILSIHRSKGLQFPVVLIPFLDWSIIPNRNDIIWAKTSEKPFEMIPKLPVSPSPNLAKSVFAADYIYESGETLLDNINLLYVAFTRAENQLHVFANKNSNVNTAGKFVLDTLQSNTEWQNKFQGEENISIQLGQPFHPQEKKSAAQNNSLYNPSSIIAGKINAIENPSAGIPELRVRYESDEIIFGNQVHQILSLINRKEDLEKTLRNYSVINSLKSNPERISDLRTTLNKVWDLMEQRGWTDPSFIVANEPEIADESGNSHRPDRVIYKNDTAIVIDFKTGAPDKAYHQQVKDYCQLLLKTGFKTVEGYLIYTTNAIIEQV